MDNKLTYIYSLSHPLTGEIRYVGKADNLKSRYTRHIHDSTPSHKRNWIRSLIKKGLKPVMEVIDFVEEDNWQFWERHYISLIKSWGFKLVNTTSGGDGYCGVPMSESVREKLRIANIGKKHSEETRAKMKESSPKYWLGKQRSDSDRVKISNAHKGKKHSEERRLKTSERTKGENHHFFGKKLSADHKSKLWLTRDRNVSEETKRKLSIAVREIWRKRKEAKCQAA